MMVWNRGKSFKISNFWVSVLNFRGLIQNYIPICGWMMFLWSLWAWDKNITCQKKKSLSPTQARHWLGEVSGDSVKPMGKLLTMDLLMLSEVKFYCWWFRNPENHQLRLVVYPILPHDLQGLGYIPGGAGFLPSTVCLCIPTYIKFTVHKIHMPNSIDIYIYVEIVLLRWCWIAFWGKVGWGCYCFCKWYVTYGDYVLLTYSQMISLSKNKLCICILIYIYIVYSENIIVLTHQYIMHTVIFPFCVFSKCNIFNLSRLGIIIQFK